MTGALRPAVAAVACLTRIPVARAIHIEPDDVGRGAWLFPVVGGAVGGVSGLLADVAIDRLPALAAGALAVALAVLLTGALHYDALADTADALGASDRDRALEIMRDHAIGAFGALALILVCLLDAALLASLAAADEAALVGLAAGACSRAGMLVPALVLPYARAGDGQGRLLAGIGVVPVVAAAALACLLSLPAGWAGIAAAGGAAAVVVVASLVAARRFGGVTGDVLGATAKLAETGALVAAVIVLGS
jgi:adenosylcobinamide-GDP ribazoletransferase